MNRIEVYPEMLERLFKDYDGVNSELLKRIPQFFNLLQDVYPSAELTWEDKFKINACLSYFAISEDMLPDIEPWIGYMDDLFICAYVLKEIAEDHPRLLESLWKNDVGIIRIIYDVLGKARSLLRDKTSEILNFTGLLKFNDMCDNMASFKSPEDIKPKIERIRTEVSNLMSLLGYIFRLEGQRPEGRNLRDFKNLFDPHEWNRVLRILQDVEIHESKFDYSHEAQIEEIRRKVLLDIDEDIFND